MDGNGCITLTVHSSKIQHIIRCHQQKQISFQRYLQVSTSGLIQLDTLEESLEVAGSKSLMIVPLDDLNEDGGTILKRLGEDLTQTHHRDQCREC